MATDECTIVGSGACPCRKGTIIVEHCVPDHPWVRANDGHYRASIDCEECSGNYGFYQPESSRPPALVLQSDLAERRKASEKAFERLKEIERSIPFQKINRALEAHLAHLRSAAARHRFMHEAGLFVGSVSTYRKHGFVLRASQVLIAADALQMKADELGTMLEDADRLLADARRRPTFVSTGIHGLLEG